MDKTPQIIAHRGVRHELPENTVVSIEAALALPGLAGVEFDVELSDAPVVLHQETLVPDSAFSKLVLATRDFVSRDWVSQKLASEIVKLDAGSWLSPQHSNVRVPYLKEVLAAEWKQKTAYLELKDPTYWGERDHSRPIKIVTAVLPDLLKFTGQLNIISFNPEILRVMGMQVPTVSRTLALWTEFQTKQAEAINTACLIGAGTISLADTMVLEAPKWVSLAHDHGLKLHVYPVSPARGEPEMEKWTAASQQPKWERLAKLNVDAILTDFPRETVQFFGL